MIVSKKQEWRIQRWDGVTWRQGLAMTYEEACAKLHQLYIAHPDRTLRIVCITHLVEAADHVGPPPIKS